MMSDLPSKLDRLVHRSRLDFMTPFGAPRPRDLRWLPAVALVALPVGYALLVVSMRDFARGQGLSQAAALAIAGMLLFFGAFVTSVLIAFFGPRVAMAAPGLDEREQMIRGRAAGLSGHIVTILVATGCFYCALAALFGLWRPTETLEWVNLGFLVLSYARLLPVLIASWLQSDPDAEDD
jgi:hypothetical protein